LDVVPFHALAVSLADPPGTSVLVAAVQWLEGTLLGTVATSVAVISVAGIGFLALFGHVSVRRALTTIAGCFILFGASSIAGGIRAAASGGEAFSPPPLPPRERDRSPLADLPKPPVDRDPYAGAAVPAR